ncbi:MAG: hypothetical protein ACREEP_06330, partial [Dongiaceae bacterium]
SEPVGIEGLRHLFGPHALPNQRVTRAIKQIRDEYRVTVVGDESAHGGILLAQSAAISSGCIYGSIQNSHREGDPVGWRLRATFTPVHPNWISLPMTLNHIPLMPGPWVALSDSEAQAFLERLTSVLSRSHGEAAFTKNLPISGLRVTPLSFYPGWLLAEGEAQVTPEEIGTFNVLYGPGFMWVIDGESEVIHDLNSGRIPDTGLKPEEKSADGETGTSPSFLPIPLTELDASVTGPDYLRFFCGSVWGDEGPFWLVESPNAAILQGAKFPNDTWRQQIKPITMRRVDDHLIGEAVVGYSGSLFWAKFKLRNGVVSMEDDKTLELNTIPIHKYQSPFRNLRPGTMKTADTRSER